MAPEEIFSQLSLWIVNLCHSITTFSSNLSYIYLFGSGSVFGIWILVLKGPEYGSNFNPDPQRWYVLW